MRPLLTAFWAVVAAALITAGLANRELVPVRLLPESIKAAMGFGPTVELPLFLIILGGFGFGLLAGVVWEWIREIPERAEARATARELARLRAEVARLRGEAARGDEVFSLLDAPPR